MLKRLTGAALAVLAWTGQSLAWGTDIYVERAAMAEAGRQICGINNRQSAARFRDRATFFAGLSPEAVDRQVDGRRQVLIARLTNASAVETFCGRIRGKDF